MTSRWNRWESAFSTRELHRLYPSVRLETDGKLGRVYSYYHYHRKRRVYLHILSPHAARINEHLALRRAQQRSVTWEDYYTPEACANCNWIKRYEQGERN